MEFSPSYPEDHPALRFEEERVLAREREVKEILDGHRGGVQVLTGGQYGKLVQVCAEAGITSKELELYMKEQNLSIVPAYAQVEAQNVTFDNRNSVKEKFD